MNAKKIIVSESLFWSDRFYKRLVYAISLGKKQYSEEDLSSLFEKKSKEAIRGIVYKLQMRRKIRYIYKKGYYTIEMAKEEPIYENEKDVRNENMFSVSLDVFLEYEKIDDFLYHFYFQAAKEETETIIVKRGDFRGSSPIRIAEIYFRRWKERGVLDYHLLCYEKREGRLYYEWAVTLCRVASSVKKIKSV